MDPDRSYRKDGLFALLLVAIVFLAYLPVLQGGFVWDDDDNVTENPYLRSFDGLKQIWFQLDTVPPYYPLAHSALWLEYQAWGLEPSGYHLVNLLLHILNALLLWQILRRLALPGAWAVAAVFALHPVHVESVAWITEQKNVLSAAFYLAAIQAYLSFSSPLSAERTPARRWPYYALTLFLFLCALLTKTVTASLPVALLLLVWWKRGRLTWRAFLPTVPLFIMGAGLGMLTAWSEREYVGAVGESWALSLPERILVAGKALWFYTAKLCWPNPVIYVYPRWQIDPAKLQAYLFPLAALALPVLFWTVRKKLGRGPLVAALFFGITLAPALGFFNIYYTRYSFVADRWVYLASIGPLALAIAAATLFLRGHGRQARRTGGVLCLLLLVLLGLGVWRQGRAYQDEETLWLDTLSKNPEAFVAHVNLGGIRLAEGELKAAGRHFTEALRIDPAHAEMHNNLGIVLHSEGRLAEASEHYLEAIRLDPASADAYANLGITLASQGRYTEAISRFREAVELSPGFASAHANLAQVLFYLRDYAGAVEHSSAAVRLQPDNLHGRLQLAEHLAGAGHFAEAARTADQAAELALRSGRQALATEIQGRAELFRQGRL